MANPAFDVLRQLETHNTPDDGVILVSFLNEAVVGKEFVEGHLEVPMTFVRTFLNDLGRKYAEAGLG